MYQLLKKLVTVTLLADLSQAAMSLFDTLDVRDPPTADNSTYGNIDQVATTHVNLALTIDFTTSTMNGAATHTMMVYETTDTVQFDVWDLLIIDM
jgi:hypothetical protein